MHLENRTKRFRYIFPFMEQMSYSFGTFIWHTTVETGYPSYTQNSHFDNRLAIFARQVAFCLLASFFIVHLKSRDSLVIVIMDKCLYSLSSHAQSHRKRKLGIDSIRLSTQIFKLLCLASAACVYHAKYN